MIIDLIENSSVKEQLLVVNAVRGVTASGLPYLNVDLKDASGQINAKKWEVTAEDETIFQPGNVILVEAEAFKYKDNLQLKIRHASNIPLEEIDVTKFIKAPPVPLEELKTKFENYVNSINNADCRKILDYFIKKYESKLFTYPAGVSVHHEFRSGLLYHMLSMADIAECLIKLYGDIDRDVLLTGIFLHDIGKTVELEGPLIFKYSLEGRLIGHISIMSAQVKQACDLLHIEGELPILLQHMIISHHGSSEYGSPVLPMTKEAFILSMIDNLDSKIVVVAKALDSVEEGEFTNKIFPLDGRTLYKPKK